MARFQEQQVGSATLQTGAAQEQQDLAQKLSAFSQRVGQMRKQVVVDKKLKEGAAAGMGKTQIEGVKRGTFSAADRAFNKGLLASHMAAVQTDIRDSISQFETEAQKDIATNVPGAVETLDQRIQGYKESMLLNVDEDVAPAVLAEIDSRYGPAVERAKLSHWNKTMEEGKAALSANLEGQVSDLSNAAKSNYPEVMAELNHQIDGSLAALEAMGVSSTKIAEMRDSISRQQKIDVIVGEAERTIGEGDPDSLERTAEDLKEVMESKLPDELKDEIYQQTTALMKDKAHLFKMAMASEIEAEEKAKARTVGDLDVGIETGHTTWQMLEWGEATGLLDPDGNGASFKKRLLNKQGTEKDLAAYDIKVAETLSGDRVRNPNDKKETEAFNRWFDANATPENEAQMLSYFVGSTGLMPTVIKDRLEGVAISGTPEQMAESARTYEIVRATRKPDAIQSLSKESQYIYANMARTARNGGDLELAAENARKVIAMPIEEREGLKLQFKTKYKPKDLIKQADNYVDDYHDEYLSWQPDTTATFQGAWAAEFEHNFMLTDGDAEVAKEMTENAFRNWGASESSGVKQIMINPPELKWGMDSATITKLKKNKAAALGVDDFLLVPDGATPTDNQYSLIGKDGKIIYNEDTGAPLRWSPSGAELDVLNDVAAIEEAAKEAETQAIADRKRAKQRASLSDVDVLLGDPSDPTSMIEAMKFGGGDA